MSLRDKYTDEEWNAIPPFTGFSFNKTIDERIEEARETMKQRIVNSFTSGMNRDTDITQIESGNYRFAENISVEQMLAERIKKENRIKMSIEKKKIITQQIFDKVKIEKTEGRTPRIILMSINDYDIFHDPNNNEYKYYFEDESSKKNKSGVYHSGFAIITHKCFTVEDGEIEIY